MYGGSGFDFSHTSDVVFDDLFRLIGSLMLMLYMNDTLLSNNEFHVCADLCVRMCVCTCVHRNRGGNIFQD